MVTLEYQHLPRIGSLFALDSGINEALRLSIFGNKSPIPIIVNVYILNKALDILLSRLDVMPDSDGAHVFMFRSKRWLI